MAATFHHGPEVIEHKDGVTVVRDVKSAVTYVNGTAPIQDVHATALAREDYINKRVIIRSRAEGAAAFGVHKAGYTIPAALDAIFDQGDGGTIIVNNVFDPDVHKEGANPDPSKVTTVDINGTISAAGLASGFSGAYECYNNFGYFPKLIIAPGYSPAATVRAEMDVVASRLHALAIADLPLGLTKQQAVAARGVAGTANTSSARTVLTYPHVVIEDTTGATETRLDPLSSRLAGVIIATDLNEGWQNSPSNREIKGVVDLEVPINFYPSDYQNDTNFLNEAGIVTAMRSFATGIRVFGNRSAAFPTSSHVENFIHARRILDMIHEAIIFYTMNYVDRLGSPMTVEAAEEGVNAYLRSKTDIAIYGGTFRFDRQKNTAEQIADGRFYYRLECHPISVMERITIDSYVDTKFISNALSLAA
ncbi:phage tail sheath subtilisin-like domain-containing protein [Rhizobium pusense]|uniref:phage tail sheath family protein n=1 Tax=Agrobacterium pusense TaxID=648995 RepID=UPI00244D0FD0|nr:phage tail sheath subtilisin-like domain-containing protein [Agrobacterium pusense]MDH1093836.1 phage tail sheath subtilisin-like domain-containing protein [Agrobacterium pusense]MDH1110268.1 phage tail sheath subtilisin-like domain-containing protein [Agrobacterium pusense]MDH2193710.1 phage tail sheath subtilisin-like domain-containing protein [Agrobacterium pusense]